MGIRVQFLVQRNSMNFALQTTLKASQTYKALWKHIALIKCPKFSLRAFEGLRGVFLVANSPVLHNRNNKHQTF
ncbi:hypothetical protein BCS89_23285 [Vibrio splendidus]|nr:hypothetical protein BCS97_23855 [Vibrio splendidus]PMP33951.1 hypothetical protein BCS89_23285 [Vibrio splendidus]PMP35827.1 hypothetical protein BCS88_08150 [Vibrio splendidus]PMP36986.1 hypothetical protein BCS87_02580 [Vibrio splendidus]PMP54415.1 hypothetical protein BCS85_22570 [Vibrio splendidus]